jgi:pimeloyl-ACP methyl ester carboxylesterase
MISAMRTRAAVTGAVITLIIVCAWMAAPYLSAAAFILDLGGSTSSTRRWLPVRVQAVGTQDLRVPTRYGSIAARLYTPRAPGGRRLIVFPGVHAGGVDEPRLAAFSRRLAGTGITVLSVPLPELRRYRISPVSTDMIEDAIGWFGGDHAQAPDDRVDAAGVSFAGGLVLVAAGRPSLAGKVRTIVSLGGHADLPRVMSYLCTGRLPDGSVQPPHDYGVMVILLAAIPKLVPADQIELTRHAVLAFLDASSFDTMDRAKAAALFGDARRMAAEAPEPAHTLLTLVNDRDVGALGPKLLPYIEELGGAAALSPARSPAAHAPVFLIHGQADRVIPSAETPLLADYLRRNGNEHVRWLLTPLLSHADLQPPHALDAWRLVRFWKDALDEP